MLQRPAHQSSVCPGLSDRVRLSLLGGVAVYRGCACADFEITVKAVGAALPEVGCVAEFSWGMEKMTVWSLTRYKKKGGGDVAEAFYLQVLGFQQAICLLPYVEVSTGLDR